MNIRLKAAEELFLQRQADEIAEQERTEKALSRLRVDLIKRFNVTLAEFQEAGVEIKAKLSYNFQILGKCLECGGEYWSTEFSDWAGLGDVLEKFEPEYHRCLDLYPARAETSADRLFDALRDFLEIE